MTFDGMKRLIIVDGIMIQMERLKKWLQCSYTVVYDGLIFSIWVTIPRVSG